MENRKEALSWWNKLTPNKKTHFTLLMYDERDSQSLTGREIEDIYKEKNKSDFDIIEMAFANQS